MIESMAKKNEELGQLEQELTEARQDDSYKYIQ